MTKAYLESFIIDNELLTLDMISNLKNFNGEMEEYEKRIKAYSEVSKQHLAALKQLNDVELAEANYIIEREKLDIENQIANIQREQELKVEIMNTSKEMLMQMASMIFYTARFREGLRFDIENYVNDGFVKGLVQKLPDFMRTKK